MDNTLNVVKTWLAANRPHLLGAKVILDTQDGSKDMQFAKSPLLPGVDASHINEDDYHVATIDDSITMDDGTVIPKLIKLTVQGNAVSKVLESK